MKNPHDFQKVHHMSLVARYHYVREKVAAVAHGQGRDVSLMVVSKGQSPADIAALIQEGADFFGENRSQEIREKWPSLKRLYPYVRLHFIGGLQSNKCKEIAAHCDGIQSIASPHHLALLASQAKLPTALYVQVNVGREPQKKGALPEDVGAVLEEAARLGVPIQGLMCIPPEGQDPKPYFAHMGRMQSLYGLAQLSMGMSHDYEEAIRLGATCVRIGSAIFKGPEALPASGRNEGHQA